jgi:hypothetical protein
MLRSGPRDMYLVRSMDWSRVARVRIDGKPYTPAELVARFEREGWPRAAAELPAPSPPSPRPPNAPRPGPSDRVDSSAARWQDSVSWLPARSLHIEAAADKWSSYSDNDGVVVRIFPCDANGNVVPVAGTLLVDLIGTQSANLTRGEPFPQLARWVRRVEPRDIAADGATYRLRFQAWHPDFDLQLGSLGVVHARLTVPGQGVFDDTASMVWVRPYSATRDRLQMHTGGRFFPQERTSRGMNDSRSGVIAPP